MRDVSEENLQKIFYNNLIRLVMCRWSKEKNRSFIACFREVSKEKGFDFENDRTSLRDVLKAAISYINSTTLAQIICYGYELILRDEEIINRMKENAGFKGKEDLFVSEDITNDYQLMNFIRNAISHNNDLENNLCLYSNVGGVYTFTLNRAGQENSKVVINMRNILDFLSEYLNSSELYKTYDMSILVNQDNIMTAKSINDSSKFIKLKFNDSEEYIKPDEMQERALIDIIKYIKKNNLLNFEFVRRYYPYKQNVVNNYLQSIDFFAMMDELYFNRSKTFNQYIDELGKIGMLKNRKLKAIEDISDLFMLNRMFQIFSTNDNKFIKESSEGVLSFERYNKLRNAIMHGTYYRDFSGNLYFYDAPRGKKDEENLKFIDVFSRDDFTAVSNAVCVKKAHKIIAKK